MFLTVIELGTVCQAGGNLMKKKSIVIVAVAWLLSLVGLGAWVTAQEAPKTNIIYLGDQNLMVVVGEYPDANGVLTGQLMVKRDGQFVPVVLKSR
jgi:hypothetical protein